MEFDKGESPLFLIQGLLGNNSQIQLQEREVGGVEQREIWEHSMWS